MEGEMNGLSETFRSFFRPLWQEAKVQLRNVKYFWVLSKVS